jgi:hypothetical protein
MWRTNLALFYIIGDYFNLGFRMFDFGFILFQIFLFRNRKSEIRHHFNDSYKYTCLEAITRSPGFKPWRI